MSAASVPGRGAIHSACAASGVSSRSGLTETNRQPRARAALTQPRVWCRDTPPGDTAAFFGDSPLRGLAEARESEQSGDVVYGAEAARALLAERKR